MLRALQPFRQFLVKLGIRTYARTQEITMSITVLDVAAYLLQLDHQQGQARMSSMKLQKLCYYVYAHSAVQNNGAPLFEDSMQAWQHGPVFPALYRHHKGKSNLVAGEIPGDPLVIAQNPRAQAQVQDVYGAFGKLHASQLRRLTHLEDPWLHARVDGFGSPLGPEEPSRAVISRNSVVSYFSGRMGGALSSAPSSSQASEQLLFPVAGHFNG